VAELPGRAVQTEQLKTNESWLPSAVPKSTEKEYGMHHQQPERDPLLNSRGPKRFEYSCRIRPYLPVDRENPYGSKRGEHPQKREHSIAQRFRVARKPVYGR